MIDIKEGTPQLAASDIGDSSGANNEVVLLATYDDVKVRYQLYLDRYIDQCMFRADAYDRANRVWNELWSIPQRTYRYPLEAADKMKVTDPTSPIIADPDSSPNTAAASWQKIINALTQKVFEVLG
ncbi:hypothetical protein ACIBCN_18715 [Nocardia sp. NPDC051052]|uniref:hypothetical protein n=1 Tax=Nocardia sp. NPDC051052 TaxID=3364322 RepID=UPI003798AE92